MPTTEEDRIRITARIPVAMRERLEEAAELAGSTLNQFVVQSAFVEAQRIIERETTIRLSQEGARRVVGLLENPPKANSFLKDSINRHRELFRGA